MTDHTNPQWLRSVGETREHLMNVMHVGLSRKGDVSTKAAALADDIRALGEARKAIGEASFFIEQLCAVVVYAATQIPPDGLWQDIFVRTMQNVQQTEGDYYDEDRESDEEYQSDEDSDEGYESDGDDEPYEDDEPDEDDEQFDDVGILFSLLSCHTDTSQGRISGLEIPTPAVEFYAGPLVWYVFSFHAYKSYEANIHRSHYFR